MFAKFKMSFRPLLVLSTVLAMALSGVVATTVPAQAAVTCNIVGSGPWAPMTLKYDLNQPGATTAISLPLAGRGFLATQKFLTINWGDGTAAQTVTSSINVPHTYAAKNAVGTTYTVTITGPICTYGSLLATADRGLVEVADWGTAPLTSLDNAFYNQTNLVKVPTVAPANLQSLNSTFMGATSFNDSSIINWDVSQVQSMAGTFGSIPKFNQDLSCWNVSNVTNFSSMFNTFIPGTFTNGANGRNDCTNGIDGTKGIDGWNMAKATTLNLTFNGQADFNRPLNSWNVANVTDMTGTFGNTATFNQDLSNWNTSKVTTMSGMFNMANLHNATYTQVGGGAFNQNLGSWNTSAVTNMSQMFFKNWAFNNAGSDSIKNWDVSKVTNFSATFQQAATFNQPIGSWNTSSATNMQAMFAGSTGLIGTTLGNYDGGDPVFNQDISGWNTAKVIDFSYMFAGNTNFNQPIGSWNTGAATSMANMFWRGMAQFYNTAPMTFNQPIGTWNTANVTTMQRMFYSNKAFNQDIGNWDVRKVTRFDLMFMESNFNNGGSDSIKNWPYAATPGTAFVLGSNLNSMFRGDSNFNQPIGNWNTSGVYQMAAMLGWATSFDQPVKFNITKLQTTYPGDNPGLNAFLGGVRLSTQNYDTWLIAAAAQSGLVYPTMQMNGGLSMYSCAATSARSALVSRGMQITDGGLAAFPSPVITAIGEGDKQLDVTFTPPTCGGVTPPSYQYSLDGGTTWVAAPTLTTVGSSKKFTITSLVNGKTYPIRVRGINGATLGAQSNLVPGTPVGLNVEVTGSVKTITYGDPLPTIGYTVPALDATDWFTSMSCNVYTDGTYATALTDATAIPGQYKTHCSGANATGLGVPISYIDGTLTINKAPLTIVGNSTSKTFGSSATLNTSTGWSITSGSLKGSDSVSTVTLTSPGTASTANVNVYDITPSAATGTNLDRYTITYSTAGKLTVTKVTGVTATAPSYTVDLSADPLATAPTLDPATLEGMISPDTWITLPTCAYQAAGGYTPVAGDAPTAGVYEITCSGGTISGNYESPITYVAGLLTVLPANTIVTAENGTSVYGSPLEDLSFMVSNLGDGDVLGDLLLISCQAYNGANPLTSTDKPGIYPVICTGVPATTQDGQDVVVVEGEYTLTKAPLTVTADSQTKSYASLWDVLGYLVSGAVAEDSIDVTLQTGGVGLSSLTAPLSVKNGPYVVKAIASFTAGDERTLTDYYDVTYIDGTLTVTPVTLTVTAPSYSLQFSDAVPSYTVSGITGWVNGEGTGTASGYSAGSCSSAYTTTTPTGASMAVTCGGFSADDYVFEYIAGTLSVANPHVLLRHDLSASDYWYTSVSTPAATASVTLKASVTHWLPGCLVTWSINPNVSGIGPWTIATTSDSPQINVDLPIGVYDVTVSASGNCIADPDTAGVVAVWPSELGSGSAGGGWINQGGSTPKQTFGYVIQVKTMKTASGTQLTYWGNLFWKINAQYRIKASLSKTITQYTNGTLSGVKPYGTFACPAGTWNTQAANALCGAWLGDGVLQKWDAATSRWVDLSPINYTLTIYDGGSVTSCKNKICQTTNFTDFFGLQFRAATGYPALPGDVPQSVPVALKQGEIKIWP